MNEVGRGPQLRTPPKLRTYFVGSIEPSMMPALIAST